MNNIINKIDINLTRSGEWGYKLVSVHIDTIKVLMIKTLYLAKHNSLYINNKMYF
jgi:hypothetical protein